MTKILDKLTSRGEEISKAKAAREQRIAEREQIPTGVQPGVPTILLSLGGSTEPVPQDSVTYHDLGTVNWDGHELEATTRGVGESVSKEPATDEQREGVRAAAELLKKNGGRS